MLCTIQHHNFILHCLCPHLESLAQFLAEKRESIFTMSLISNKIEITGDSSSSVSSSPLNVLRSDRVDSRHVRRRHLALATAVAISAVVSPCSAFSSSTPCYVTQQYTHGGSRGRSCLPRSSQSPLKMVSFLDAPTTLSTRKDRRDSSRKKPSKSNVHKHNILREGKQPSASSRTIEIEIPDIDDVDLENGDGLMVASHESLIRPHTGYRQSSDSSNRIPPDIDSEILYEGIKKAPKIQNEVIEVITSHTNSTADSTTDVSVNAPALKKNKSPHGDEAESSKANPEQSSKKKNQNKSSTMPGFIKDDNLDGHIANRSLRMVASRRQVSRMVRSKSAKLKRRQVNSEAMYRKSASVPDSLVDYAQEIHSVSRVTPKEEIELGTKTQEAIRLQRMYEDLQAKYGRDPTDDEWCAEAGKINMEALRQAIDDGIEAKNQLVASNLRMVQRVVNLYIRNGLGSEYNAGDLMQDGTMALIRAAEKFEPERGFRFSTYAMYWIRSAVKRSQTMQSRIVNVPQRIHETYKRVTKAETRLRKELGREPNKTELAAACDITTVQLDRCRRAMQQAAFSLDAEVQNTYKPNSSTTRKDTMYDIVAAKVDETEYEKTQRLMMREHLISTLRRYLSPHEVDLLLLRYGLMDERALPRGMSGPLTIAQVSQLVGLKPDKVRRIIINSQKQLRHLMKEWEDFECELA
mmetsp:Transcript_22224/g.46561  ORF Transcript_22224/g.46561 Transcript_22224/m.46561 type:complete len:692 (-) Transcript_22224:142-2217(-)